MPIESQKASGRLAFHSVRLTASVSALKAILDMARLSKQGRPIAVVKATYRVAAPNPFGGNDVTDIELRLLIEDANRWRRQHGHFQSQRKRLGLATGAALRTMLGWGHGIPEKDRKAIENHAADLMKAGDAYYSALRTFKRKGGDEPVAPDVLHFGKFASIILPNCEVTEPFDRAEGDAEKMLTKLGKKLPAAEWWCSHRGLSAKYLAEIVGECGDIANYRGPRALWKRLGLAPYEGHAYSTWRTSPDKPRSLTAEEWVDAGYTPRRRSLMYLISASVLKANGESVAKGARNPFMMVYRMRREHTALTHPEWSKAHSHNDGMRIMVKEILKSLWAEWRRSIVRMEAKRALADSTAQSEPVGNVAQAA